MWPFGRSSSSASALAEEARAKNGGQLPALALYYYDWCGYCRLVMSELDRLGLDVEMRNILDEPKHASDLVAARGRRTVPVLHITHADGEVQWLPESRDIVEYLRELTAS